MLRLTWLFFFFSISSFAALSYSVGPCHVTFSLNANPDNTLLLDLDVDHPDILWHKAKTFARRVGEPDQIPFIRRTLDELYAQCLKESLAGTLDPDFLNAFIPAAAHDQALALPRPVFRPPTRWVLADFNGDGRSDSVIPSSNLIFVQLAQPTGAAADPVRIALGPGTHGYASAAAADVNGDRRQDLVLCCAGFGVSGRIVIALGNGDGTFQPPRESVPSTPAFTLADMNGDGRPDLIAVSPAPALTVSLGQPNGTFEPSATFPLSSTPIGLVAVDMTGDGRPDVLAVNASSIQVFPSQPNGSFLVPVTTALPFNTARTFVAADFNGDRRLDAAIFDPNLGLAAMMFGLANNEFRHTALAATGNFESAFAADLNGDNLLELMIPSAGSGDLTFVPISASGGLGTSPLYRLAGSAPTAATPGDFNADGKADLALAAVNSSGDAILGILRGNAPLSRFSLVTPVRTLARARITALASADFNADQRLDLAALDAANGSLLLLRGNRDGTFDTPFATPLGASAGDNLAIGDLNGDGLPDAAAASSSGIRLAFGNRTGPFTNPVVVPTPLAPLHIALADLNADNRLDIVFTTTFDPQGRSQAGFVLQRADSTFAPAQSLPIPPTTNFTGLAVGDLNGDGRPEILLAGSIASGPLLVYLNQGNAAFAPVPSQREIAFGPHSPLLSDLDGDGKLDLILAHCCGELGTRYHYGLGDGSFSASYVAPTFQGATRLWLADFNGDRKLELAAQNDAGVAIHPFTIPGRLANVSAASNLGPTLASSSIASAYGVNLSTGIESASAPNQTALAGSRVDLIDASNRIVPAPLFFVSPGQVNYLVPPGLRDGPIRVNITSASGLFSSGDFAQARIAPGLFLAGSTGLLAANLVRVKASGEQIPEDITGPIDFGPEDETLVLILYGTGIRRRNNLNSVRAVFGLPFGTLELPALFAGDQGGFAGLDQVNVILPRSLAGRGSVEVILLVENQRSNPGRVIFR